MSDLGAWLRDQRLARHWNKVEMGRRIHQAAKAADDTFIPRADVLATYVRRWEVNKMGVSERYRIHYCTALGIQPSEFGPPQPAPKVKDGPEDIDAAGSVATPLQSTQARLRMDLPYGTPQLGGYRGGVMRCDTFSGEEWQPRFERSLIQAAAHESSGHAEWSEASNVGEATLEQLDADVRRIAADYVHAPPLPMFAEMLRVRNRIYGLLAGRQKPAATTHLYLLAGMLCGLLANASTDLGYRDAAAEQARAAWAYGDIIGHNSLRAWTRGMQALIEYWSGRPQRAVQLVRNAVCLTDSTTSIVRLQSIEARAWSLLGDFQEANRCLGAANDARESTANDDELHDEVGGVFGFAVAKGYCYAGASFMHLDKADAALAATSHAVRLYVSGPVTQRSYGAEALARIDMAEAYFLKRRLDGVIDNLAPVLTIPVEQRIAQLADRLINVRGRLRGSEFDGASEARTLCDQIDNFAGETLARELGDLDSGE